MSRLDPLLRTLSEAPPAQIDGSITKKIARLIGCTNEVVATELKEVRDECKKNATLASPFARKIIEQAIEVAELGNK